MHNNLISQFPDFGLKSLYPTFWKGGKGCMLSNSSSSKGAVYLLRADQACSAGV